MGSILMHICISEEIRKKYCFSNKFLIGCLLPDIYKRTTMTRDESHYIVKTVEDGYIYQLPDLNRYVEENKDDFLKDEVKIGYYTHLVEDYVWFKYVSGHISKVREDEEDKDIVRYRKDNFKVPHLEEEYCTEIYKDYSNFNEWLFEKYPVDTIVVGMPYNMNGTKTERADVTEKFIHTF